MNIKELLQQNIFEIICEGDHLDREITKPFCCDLLSIAMGKAQAGCAWVTVMGNINTLAVASLTETACIILAEGIQLDQNAMDKAKVEGITVLGSKHPIYDTAKLVDLLING